MPDYRDWNTIRDQSGEDPMEMTSPPGYYHAHMTVTGNNVFALLSGQLDGKPINYLIAPGERKRITFDAVQMKVWWGRYGVTYTTRYFESSALDARCFGGFTETYLLPDGMIAEAHTATMSGKGWLYESPPL